MVEKQVNHLVRPFLFDDYMEFKNYVSQEAHVLNKLCSSALPTTCLFGFQNQQLPLPCSSFFFKGIVLGYLWFFSWLVYCIIRKLSLCVYHVYLALQTACSAADISWDHKRAAMTQVFKDKYVTIRIGSFFIVLHYIHNNTNLTETFQFLTIFLAMHKRNVFH